MTDVTMYIHLSSSLYPKKRKVHPVVYFFVGHKKTQSIFALR